MKTLLTSIMVGVLAVSGSTYKNLHKTISDNFMVQTVWGVYTRSDQGNGVCILPSPYPCKYFVTTLGKINIPDQLIYTIGDINTYVLNGWLWLDDDNNNRIYLEI